MFLSSRLESLRRIASRLGAKRRLDQRRPVVRPRLEVLEDRALPSGSYLFVSDYDANTVMRYDAATGAFVDTFVPKHSGGLNQPQGLVLGPHDHNLYIASGEYAPSSEPHTSVLRFDGTSGTFMDRFADKGRLGGPHAVVFGPDGNLYVADGFTNGDAKPSQIVRYHGTTGEFMDIFVPSGSGGLWGPWALVFGPSGRGAHDLDLYVVSRRTDSVKRYDGATGAYLGDFVASGSGGLDAPLGLTFGPDGNLYVSAGFGAAPSAVFRFQGPAAKTPGAPMPSAENSGALFVASGSGGLLDTFGLIFGPDSNGDGQQDLYLPSFEQAGSNKSKEKTATIKRYDGVTGGFIDTFVTPNSGGLDQPNYLIFSETDPVTLAYRDTMTASVTTSLSASSASAAIATAHLNGSRQATLTDPSGNAFALNFALAGVLHADGSAHGTINFVFSEAFSQAWGAVSGVDSIRLQGTTAGITVAEDAIYRQKHLGVFGLDRDDDVGPRIECRGASETL